MNKNNYVNKLHDLLKDELQYIIKRINKRPKTTKNNYAEYYRQIIELKNITNLNYDIIAELLVLSGGNKYGISSALQIIKG